MTSMNRALQTYFAYKFIKLLVKDFKDWDAYKMGLIDENGTRIKSVKPTTTEERAQVGVFMNLTRKAKRMLQKIPGGRTLFGSVIAASMLLREESIKSNELVLTNEFVENVINECLSSPNRLFQEADDYKYYKDDLSLLCESDNDEFFVLEPNVYELREEFLELFDDNPIFYVQEEAMPDISFGFPLYKLRDTWGKDYWLPLCALTKITRE